MQKKVLGVDKRNMEIFDKNFREILSSQIVVIIGGLIAGTLLAVFTKKLYLIPGMLILIPGFLEMRGSIAGNLSARITSALFLKTIKSKYNRKTLLVNSNIHASMFLALVASLGLGLMAFALNYLVSGIFFPQIILIPIIAAVLSEAIETPLTIFSTFYIFRKGHDPNNFMGPIITTGVDIISITALMIAMVAI
ncbi:MAG: magnesium transporter [Nanoarchaeota archaeon]